jgi:hypothetical protein
MPIKILAGPVVAHSGPRISVPGGDLHVPQVHPGVKHRGHARYLYSIRKEPGKGVPGK